jgi:hypothetical protein
LTRPEAYTVWMDFRFAFPGQDIDLPEPVPEPTTIKAAVMDSRFPPSELDYLLKFESLQTQNSVLAQTFWRKWQHEIKVGITARQHQAIVDAAERRKEAQAMPRNSLSAAMTALPPREQTRFFQAHREGLELEASHMVDRCQLAQSKL